jgi:hypothetical protein
MGVLRLDVVGDGAISEKGETEPVRGGRKAHRGFEPFLLDKPSYTFVVGQGLHCSRDQYFCHFNAYITSINVGISISIGIVLGSWGGGISSAADGENLGKRCEQSMRITVPSLPPYAILPSCEE